MNAEDSGDETLLGGGGAPMRVTVNAPWRVTRLTQATGDGPLGRGARGAVPLHLTYEARDIVIAPGQPVTWQMTLKPGIQQP